MDTLNYICLFISLVAIILAWGARMQTTGIKSKDLFSIWEAQIEMEGRQLSSFTGHVSELRYEMSVISNNTRQELSRLNSKFEAYNDELNEMNNHLIMALEDIKANHNRMDELFKEVDNHFRDNTELMLSVVRVNADLKTTKERWNWLCDKLNEPAWKYQEQDKEEVQHG
jgi:uncharacterized coiled-coil DUF342 family protein